MQKKDAYEGMRVVFNGNSIASGSSRITGGETGTIVYLGASNRPGVKFDSLSTGHNLSGRLPSDDHSGWYVLLDYLEPYFEDDDLISPYEIDIEHFMEV